MKYLLILLILFGCSFANRTPSSETSDSIRISKSAKTIPWGGYWWSMERGELVMGWETTYGRKKWSTDEILKFDKCLTDNSSECKKFLTDIQKEKSKSLSPMMKFDLFVKNELEKSGKVVSPLLYSRAAKNEMSIHYLGYWQNPDYADFGGFAGKCLGWALSTFDFNEPTKDVELNGIKFTPADIKGFLAAVYYGATFFVPDENFKGNAYYGDEATDGYNPKVARKDVTPEQLFNVLKLTIDNGKMFEADLDPEQGTWNYPVFKYDLDYKKISAKKVEGKVILYYVDDEVHMDEVFSLEVKRRDIKKRELNFTILFKKDFTGDLSLDVASSEWIGDSQNTHPDSIITGLEKDWRSLVYQYSSDSVMKRNVNFQLIKRGKIGNKNSPWIDELFKRYFK